MYHAKIWNEDKLDVRASYSSSKYGNIFSDDNHKEDKQYHEQKYGQSDGNVSSDFMRGKEAKDKDEEKKHDMFEDIDEKQKQPELKDDEDIKFAAAKQVFHEMKQPGKSQKKKDVNSIEDAIKKAIDSEKKVIIMDN